MSRSHISAQLRQLLAQEANYRCGYCLSTEVLSGIPLTVDHIMPISLGGSHEQENLWLACRSCNEFKGNKIEALDSQTGKLTPLFDPRRQDWYDHFYWDETGVRILDKTPIGRVTIAALNMNHELIVKARRRWVAAGWHPPNL